nr:hypothetical protein [Nocardiopsis halotolerans]
MRERLRQRRVTQDDVLATPRRPLDGKHGSTDNSYELYGWTGDGRKIYVAVKDTTWGTPDPVIKTVVEVSGSPWQCLGR